MRDDGALLAEARTVMVFVKDGRSVPIPADFTARFAAAPEGDAPWAP